MAKKFVYLYGDGKAEGDRTMKELLGGKGANLAEMAGIGLPVPAGFTVTTEVCTEFLKNNKEYPKELKAQVEAGMSHMEKIMGKKYGDVEKPLLVSVRSGAAVSMPGMMETVLNVGLTSKTIPGMIKLTNNERFVYDAYRRLIMMYSDVVMEKSLDLEPVEGKGIRVLLEELIEEKKKEKKVEEDTELTAEDWKVLSEQMKDKIKSALGKPFPDDPIDQLWGSISAVFLSWNGKRAIDYRRIEKFSDDMGTAVNIVAMVFGNMGSTSGTGVGFSRDPSNGANKFYGEWLANAQGEDVVAGIRTPHPINEYGVTEKNKHLITLEKEMPVMYKELFDIQHRLEKHYRDMQDIEFTIEQGKLWMLQCRVGKRNGVAAIQMAVSMVEEGLITEEEAVMRVKPNQLDEMLHPMLDPVDEKLAMQNIFAVGLPAGPGAGVGEIVLTAEEAEEKAAAGRKVILVRNETSPEDVSGMHKAEAILTAKGGMTSHAALVARGWGKCCIVGCGALSIDIEKGTVTAGKKVLKRGDIVSLNGTKGNVYLGAVKTVKPDIRGGAIMKLLGYCDKIKRLGVRANADNPRDAKIARDFGAIGIGLTRTEHMFFDEQRIKHVREMIVAKDEATRRAAVMKLEPFQKSDFYGLFKAMDGLPVTIRLLDPPLHEFLPPKSEIENVAKELGITPEELETHIETLHEMNPMMGHRGCRLGISHPEISEMQAMAIFEAAAQCKREGIDVHPEVMIPLITTVAEFENQAAIVNKVAAEVQKKNNVKIEYLVGTMIETPRATVVADKVAEKAQFFSFGTNDLTQMTFGFSRDDVNAFLPYYIAHNILPTDPFQQLDQNGVGQLVKMACEKGRSARPDIKLGICGEHGGEASSVEFCHRIGLNYVSCSPYRIPISRLAAAQAVLRERK